MISKEDEIYNNYIDRDGDKRYYDINKDNQRSYDDNFSIFLPKDKSAKILEIGCGAGQFLYFLKAKGYLSLEGVDIGKDQINFLKAMDIEGHVISSIECYLRDKNGRYDLIIMNQVIEHLPKDVMWQSIKAIYLALKDGATFIFMTPNMASFSGVFQRYIDFTHEIGFTERSAYQVLKIIGFKDILIRGEIVRLTFNPKRIVWYIFGNFWRMILKLVYTIERGSDRPNVLERNLIAVGKK